MRKPINNNAIEIKNGKCGATSLYTNPPIIDNCYAIRVARAYTKKNKIVKFEGAYHGWHDYVSVSSHPSLKESGSRKPPLSVPDTEGLFRNVTKNTIVVPFNDSEVVEKTIKKHKNTIATLITEPILHGNAACKVPKDGFLRFLRGITEENDVILIFDVISGFRHHLGGAQKLFKVTSDLTTFGKAMENGFPVAAICGKKDVLEMFKPTGKVDYIKTFRNWNHK